MSGYPTCSAPNHPRANASLTTKSPWIYEHVLIAEAALGMLLPAGAEIHHVDNDRRNNAKSNLVVCQDKAYHKLLHVRTRIVRAGGNPNTDKICCDCHAVKPLTDFNVRRANKSTGRQSPCRDCAKVRDAAKRQRRMEAA